MELNDYISNVPGSPPELLKPVTTSNDPDPLPLEKVVGPILDGPIIDGPVLVKPIGGAGPTYGDPWPFKDIPDPRPFDNEEKVI